MSWRESVVTSLLEEKCRDESPPDLTGRILERVVEEPKLPRFRTSYLAAALVLLGIAVALTVAFAANRETAPAQDPANKSWMPLIAGSEWHYRVTDGPRSHEFTETVRGSVEHEGRELFLVVRSRIDASHQQHARLVFEDSLGIWRDFCEHDMRLLNRARGQSHRILSLPIEAGKAWDTTLYGPPIAATFGCEVIEASESVTVPAGTFDAVRVRTTWNPSERDATVEDLWYARGVGVVKSSVEGENGQLAATELIGYTRGKPSFDARMRLPMLLAKDPVLGERGMPDQIQVVPVTIEGLMFESAFARVRYGREWSVLRVGRDSVQIFDPHRDSDWDALITDEGVFDLPAPLHESAVLFLCGLACRLEAAERGLAVEREVDFVELSRVNNRLTMTMDAFVVCEDQTQLACRIQLTNGRVERLTVD